jgi:hypothetical protein
MYSLGQLLQALVDFPDLQHKTIFADFGHKFDDFHESHLLLLHRNLARTEKDQAQFRLSLSVFRTGFGDESIC